jgi:hypothetical protein
MDLLNLIKSKVSIFEASDMYEGLEAVIHHIEIAERHFENGGQYDEYFYTDVIYRTNQAFEGALKEAYRSFAEADPSRKTPAQIEKYLESKELLKERVLVQFKNYRSEWRNKSTHDYKLFFSSQEALLAVVSVSAFCSILLDEMLEKHAYDTEISELSNKAGDIVVKLGNYHELEFHQQCLEILAHFSASHKRENNFKGKFNEFELRGKLAAYISTIDPEISIQTEVPFAIGSRRAMVDIILKKGESGVIIELKRPSKESRLIAMKATQQVASYLAVSGLTEGILYIPPYDKDSKVVITNESYEFEDLKKNISVIRA